MNLVHNWESFDLFINKGIISEEDLNCVKDKFIKFLYSSLASYHMDRDIREDVCDIIWSLIDITIITRDYSKEIEIY